MLPTTEIRRPSLDRSVAATSIRCDVGLPERPARGSCCSCWLSRTRVSRARTAARGRMTAFAAITGAIIAWVDVERLAQVALPEDRQTVHLLKIGDCSQSWTWRRGQSRRSQGRGWRGGECQRTVRIIRRRLGIQVRDCGAQGLFGNFGLLSTADCRGNQSNQQCGSHAPSLHLVWRRINSRKVLVHWTRLSCSGPVRCPVGAGGLGRRKPTNAAGLGRGQHCGATHANPVFSAPLDRI